MASDTNDIKLKDQEIAENEAIARIQLIEAQTDLAKAQAIKTTAEAEAVEPGNQLAMYKAYVDGMAKDRQHERELKKMGIEQEMEEDAAKNAPLPGEGPQPPPMAPGETTAAQEPMSPPPTEPSLPALPDGMGGPQGMPTNPGEGMTSEVSGGMHPNSVLPDLKAEVMG
jgi:hypothetical protein